MQFAPPPPRPASDTTDPDGILLVDKPAGMTSSDVVVAVRRMFRLKKTGHGGTLDPGATGLLVLLIGRGTRAQDRIMGGDKTYQGTLRLGRETSTQDWEGETRAEADPSGVTEAALRDLIDRDRSTNWRAAAKKPSASRVSSTSTTSRWTTLRIRMPPLRSAARKARISARSATTLASSLAATRT